MEPLIRRAQSEDFAGIRDLLALNYVGNLSEDERKEGFLSIDLSEKELLEMASNGITVVAVLGNQVGAFLSTQTCEYNRRLALPAKMLEALDENSQSWFEPDVTLVCGPVCVSKEFRGQGLLQQLYKEMAREAAGHFTIGISFVSGENPRSLRAHVSGLKMNIVCSFDFRGKSYEILFAPLSQYL